MEELKGRPRIVLADDNFTTQQVLRLSFAGEDLDIECCDNGEAALKEVATRPTDVLLVNVYLPDMDGYELCRRLRAEGHSTRVIMLVGAFQSFDEEKARAVGCRHSLSKPFDTYSLVNLVKDLIEAGPEPLPEPEPETLQASEKSPWLFEPALSRVGDEMIFELSLEQCPGRANHLAREIVSGNFPSVSEVEPEVPLSEAPGVDRDLLLEKLNERLPDAIRRLLPDIVRELDESR